MQSKQIAVLMMTLRQIPDVTVEVLNRFNRDACRDGAENRDHDDAKLLGNLCRVILAIVENPFSCPKCELTHLHHYKTRSQAMSDIFKIKEGTCILLQIPFYCTRIDSW